MKILKQHSICYLLYESQWSSGGCHPYSQMLEITTQDIESIILLILADIFIIEMKSLMNSIYFFLFYLWLLKVSLALINSITSQNVLSPMWRMASLIILSGTAAPGIPTDVMTMSMISAMPASMKDAMTLMINAITASMIDVITVLIISVMSLWDVTC